MPLVHEEMPLVVSLPQVHGCSEPPLHVVLPFAFVPVQTGTAVTPADRNKKSQLSDFDGNKQQSINTGHVRMGDVTPQHVQRLEKLGLRCKTHLLPFA